MLILPPLVFWIVYLTAVLTARIVVFIMLKLLAKAFVCVIQYLIFHLEEGEEGRKGSLIFFLS